MSEQSERVEQAELDFPGKGRVAAIRTRPRKVLEDFGTVMSQAGADDLFANQTEVVIKPVLGSSGWLAGTSTSPWQLEGVVRKLQAQGVKRLIAAQDKSQVRQAYTAENNNKLTYVFDKYSVEDLHLYEPEVEWTIYEPKADMLVLHDVYPEGVEIPKFMIGQPVVELPALEAGAMAAAAGYLADGLKAFAPDQIDRALVDLLTIQREIHPNLLVVADGTLLAGGREADLILASTDPVAIDALVARMRGIDPLSIESIRLAHELGLGVGDPDKIEIVGDQLTTGPLPVEPEVKTRNPLANRRLAVQGLETRWGEMFRRYDDGSVALEGRAAPGPLPVAAAILALILALVIIGKRSRRS